MDLDDFDHDKCYCQFCIVSSMVRDKLNPLPPIPIDCSVCGGDIFCVSCGGEVCEECKNGYCPTCEGEGIIFDG